MTWLWLPIVASLCYSISGFIDNFLTDTYCRKLNPKCLAFIYIIVDLVVCAGIVVFTQGSVFTNVTPAEIGIFIAAAVMNFFASIPYCQALKRDETTEIALLSQMAPVVALILGWLFLQEAISPIQLFAFFLILAAAVFIIVSPGHKKHIKIKASAAGFMVIACFFWVMSDVVFVLQARDIDFVSSLFWFLMGGILVNALAFVFLKKWRQDVGKLLTRQRPKKLLIMTANELTWMAGETMWRLAIVLMPVAIVTVTGHVSQLILTFVLGIILTVVAPKFGREKLNRKLIRNHAIATIVVAVALVLLEMNSF